MFWKPTIAIQGDVGTFLRELSIILMEYKCNQQWLAQLRDADEQKEAANTRVYISFYYKLLLSFPREI